MSFFFFEIQGIFPKRQHEVAEKIGRLVSDELLSSDDIREKIQKPEHVAIVTHAIEEKIDEYLNYTFPNNYPISSVLFGNKRKNKIKEDLLMEVNKAAPDVIDQYLQGLEESLQIEEMVKEKINALSPEMLEKLIMQILKKEFAFIEWIGAVIGFLIGLLQIGLVKFMA